LEVRTSDKPQKLTRPEMRGDGIIDLRDKHSVKDAVG